MNVLGFDKGMIYFWESWEFDWQGVEVKLSKYTDDYFTWEIEVEKDEADLNKIAKSLGLIAYNREQYKEAIDWENKNIHKLFSFELVEKLLLHFTPGVK